ncbi:prp10 [Candida pseudojiufengensis]|uniref:prp10 n=1 Tax=Candida pseudojiufengensis TaxID=497109 RepID=UPI002224ACFD|nr:prp10 [Candida pseudojiufengensis]KAI5965571.1 prp10 [Candida pseudojiufengensis]
MSKNGATNRLTGSYTISEVLNNELQKEFERDVSVSNQTLQDEINKNDYNKQKRPMNGNFTDERTYKDIMKERDLEREEKKVQHFLKEGSLNGTNSAIEMKKKRKLNDGSEEVTGAELEKSSLVQEIKEKNIPVISGIPLTDEILSKLLPEGFIKVEVPPEYQQITLASKPDISSSTTQDNYFPPTNEEAKISTSFSANDITAEYGLEYFKEEDVKYFGNLLKINIDDLNDEEKKEVQSMKLILKVKNGTQIVRKKALRSLTDNATKFGPKIILSQVLPIILEPALGELEKHLLIKLVGKMIHQLNASIRPYTQKIIHVLSPFLIDEDSTLRNETRSILTNLVKAVGFGTMISTLRPDLDHVDEYVRNLTSRVLAIVANTLGLSQYLPFVKAVVKSRKNWTARHTGIKSVQQLCITLGKGNGSVILPYLSQLIEILSPAIHDESPQVKAITANTVAQLAENVAPYGIESFEQILEPLWFEIRRQKGKSLAAFLKCIGSIIPLMAYNLDYEEYTNYYTTEVMHVIIRQFSTPDEDMRKTILKILSILPLSEKLVPEYHDKLVKPFFKSFWNRRTASDNLQIVNLVVAATNHLAIRFDFSTILNNIIYFSKDDNEQLRRLSIEALNVTISNQPDELVGFSPQRIESLVDGVLFAFQEQSNQNKIYLRTFGTIANALGVRMKPHLNSIISSVLYRVKNKSPEVRQQSFDLIAIIAPVIKLCAESDDNILQKLILILYESLGEVYPDVLGSIINALYSCINSLEKSILLEMDNPSVNQILPTLTPILKNRHEKVQESSIKLIGLIATKNAETINAKEWMRICFDLLEMLKSNKKKIRVEANATFGYISKTIGPQDVIVMLLNNLKVQERQLRVCTAVAMGIVAETCQPFTVLPAIMNEYKTPEKNVQNGILKALSFLFEYLDGNTTKDYLFAITPLLEDALIDRDLVHRQTASTVVFHIAINCYGIIESEYYEVFMHLLNLILPNIYETSPHVIARIMESLDSLRLVLGNGIFMNYVWAGLFHPARKVRIPFWKVYNSAFVQCSDALVPYYPRIDHIPDDENVSRYYVEELDLCL